MFQLQGERLIKPSIVPPGKANKIRSQTISGQDVKELSWVKSREPNPIRQNSVSGIWTKTASKF